MSCPLHGIWTPLKHWYLFLGDTGPVTCLDGWVLYIDHCYKIFRETKGWEEALTSCQKEGSHLASIQSLEEHSFLVSQLGYSECFGGAFAFVCMWEAPASAGELQLRCSNCINMKHCSQRRAKSQRSRGVRRVQCSASCFKTEATFGAATCRLTQLSWLVLCFALLRVEGHQSSQWEAFLVKGLWNITSTLQECFLWKTNVFVLLSMHLGNLQCGSKPSSTSCGQPAPRSASSQVSAEVMEGTY